MSIREQMTYPFTEGWKSIRQWSDRKRSDPQVTVAAE
jgi:hypothetical protein